MFNNSNNIYENSNKNIKIENNFNFNDELLKAITEDSDDESEYDNKNRCLISLEPLTDYAIRLDCNHSFNYIPLYKEVVKQKTMRRMLHPKWRYTFKCPYCRNINSKLLPFISDLTFDDKENFICKPVIGVNTPMKFTMSLFTCEHTFKSGKKKGQMCNKPCNNLSKMCNTHHKAYEKNLQKNAFANENTTNSLVLCNAILVSGKRKGLPCNCKKIYKDNLCKRHYTIKNKYK